MCSSTMWSYYDIANPECQYAQLPLDIEYTMDPSPIEDRNAETAAIPPADDKRGKTINDITNYSNKAINDITNDSDKAGALGDLDVSVNMGGFVVRDTIDLPKERDSKTEDENEGKDNEEDDALLEIESIENEIDNPSTLLIGYQRVYRDTLM